MISSMLQGNWVDHFHIMTFFCYPCLCCGVCSLLPGFMVISNCFWFSRYVAPCFLFLKVTKFILTLQCLLCSFGGLMGQGLCMPQGFAVLLVMLLMSGVVTIACTVYQVFLYCFFFVSPSLFPSLCMVALPVV